MDADLLALLEHARPLAASDLYLAEGRPPFLRRKAVLEEIDAPPTSRELMESLFLNCGADPATTLDRDYGFNTPDGLRFRANLHRRAGKLGAVLRHVRAQIPTMENLGLPEALLTTWLKRTSGLVLVAGPTGSGKSTTLASCLEWVNHNHTRHIVTIEDPIEFLFSDASSIFTQREVGSDTSTFASGMRSALRQAPDIIFLGEIRDRETATIALQAAETGQLVVSTMQSNGIIDTFTRLVALFDEQDRPSALHLIATRLLGLVCQNLLPGTGDGLYLALEYFENEGATRDWIRECSPKKIVDQARTRNTGNSLTFFDSLVWGCQNEKVAYETALAASENPSEFNRALRGIS